jgi:hypothetical protein
MEEIWKDIKGYEGLYRVSSLGKVKSIKRVVYRSDGTIQTLKERILSPGNDGRGYYKVLLYKNKKNKTFSVHKLVAMAFLGHKPCGYNEVVDHIDGNKLNNRLDNLQITTQRHNASKDKKGTSSIYTGVSWHKKINKWESRIYINGKKKYLGLFEKEIDAHKAYQKRLKEINN